MGNVSAHERRGLFITWGCDAVDDLTQRMDIIRRAFRGTEVGIDVDGKMKDFIRFPGYETYKAPEKDEEHNEDPLSKEEIEAMEKAEIKYQVKKKKRKHEEREEAIRKRARLRAENM